MKVKSINTVLSLLAVFASQSLQAQTAAPTTAELQQQLTALSQQVQVLQTEKAKLTQDLSQLSQQQAATDTALKDLKSEFSANAEIPVGSIVAWHKDLAGTPDLGADWQICDGQLITDPESPMYGQSTPDLNSPVYANGKGKYLRGGNTSGLFNESTRLSDNGYKYGFTNRARYYGVAVFDVHNAEDWNGNFYSETSRVGAYFQTTAMTVVWAIKIK